MNRLLDSVILIDHFNGVGLATDYLMRWAPDCAISAITRADVLTGFDEADWALPMALLSHYPVLSVDATIADEAARLRRQYRWKLPDALQASFAILNGLRLVTRNTRDFPPDKFGFVDIPYQITPPQ
jgi:predicted nucleic acid-binding protein